MFKLENIDHVALTVSNLQHSTKWYQEVLDLERRYEKDWPNEPVMLCVGNTCIALFQAIMTEDAMSPIEAPIGMSHVAFKVDRENFEQARAELAWRGIKLRYADHGISHSVYLSDPDGHQIEITTYDVDV